MPRTSFSSFFSTFILCFALWLLLTWSLAAQELIAGALISVAVACFTGRFLIHQRPFYLFNPLRLFRLVFYCLGTFMWELWKANWDMARRALSPSLPINPGIVKVPVELESEYGQAMLANSITLTPGTITMEITEEDGQNYFYIHWIDVAETDREQAAEAIKGRMERALRRIWL